MNEETKPQTLVELRKIRKAVTGIFLVMAILVVCDYIIPSFRRDSQNGPCWGQVRSDVEAQQFTKALAMAKTLVAAQPDYDYGHTYLGYVYLAMDDLTNAETQYARAFELFPSRINKENMEAVQKRIAASQNTRASPH